MVPLDFIPDLEKNGTTKPARRSQNPEWKCCCKCIQFLSSILGELQLHLSHQLSNMVEAVLMELQYIYFFADVQQGELLIY